MKTPQYALQKDHWIRILHLHGILRSSASLWFPPGMPQNAAGTNCYSERSGSGPKLNAAYLTCFVPSAGRRGILCVWWQCNLCMSWSWFWWIWEVAYFLGGSWTCVQHLIRFCGIACQDSNGLGPKDWCSWRAILSFSWRAGTFVGSHIFFSLCWYAVTCNISESVSDKFLVGAFDICTESEKAVHACWICQMSLAGFPDFKPDKPVRLVEVDSILRFQPVNGDKLCSCLSDWNFFRLSFFVFLVSWILV